MTRFSAGLAEARRLSEPGAPKIPINIVALGGRVAIGPFDVEFVPVAHSIPESCMLAIRTPAGVVVHTGDWKIDPTPPIGLPTDERRLREIGIIPDILICRTEQHLDKDVRRKLSLFCNVDEEAVVEAIYYMNKNYNGTGYPADAPAPAWDVAFPEASGILKDVVHDSAKRQDPKWTVLVIQAAARWSFPLTWEAKVLTQPRE